MHAGMTNSYCRSDGEPDLEPLPWDDPRRLLDDDEEDPWLTEEARREMAGPPPEEIMHLVWQIDIAMGRCNTGYREWRDGLPGEDWVRRLSDPQDDKEGEPWTSR